MIEGGQDFRRSGKDIVPSFDRPQRVWDRG